MHWLPTVILYLASAAVFALTFLGGYEPRLPYVIVGAALMIVGRIAAHFADQVKRPVNRPEDAKRASENE